MKIRVFRTKDEMGGAAAALALRDGRTGVMVGELHGDVAYTPFAETVNQRKPLDSFELKLADILP